MRSRISSGNASISASERSTCTRGTARAVSNDARSRARSASNAGSSGRAQVTSLPERSSRSAWASVSHGALPKCTSRSWCAATSSGTDVAVTFLQSRRLSERRKRSASRSATVVSSTSRHTSSTTLCSPGHRRTSAAPTDGSRCSALASDSVRSAGHRCSAATPRLRSPNRGLRGSGKPRANSSRRVSPVPNRSSDCSEVRLANDWNHSSRSGAEPLSDRRRRPLQAPIVASPRSP